MLPQELAVDIAHFYSEFSELRPEVVHTWLDWDNVRGGLAAALAGVPRVVISGRNINPSHFALYQPYMDPAYRVLAQLPNVTIINNSRAGADDYADWIGIPHDRIKVVYNAVDFGDRRRLSVRECADLRASLKFPQGSFVIGGVFRLEEEKRPILWVQTAALLARQVPNIHFVIFGQGTRRDAILEVANEKNLPSNYLSRGHERRIVGHVDHGPVPADLLWGGPSERSPGGPVGRHAGRGDGRRRCERSDRTGGYRLGSG